MLTVYEALVHTRYLHALRAKQAKGLLLTDAEMRRVGKILSISLYNIR